jgi:poly(3-hydroxybutyrate) depolymerase
MRLTKRFWWLVPLALAVAVAGFVIWAMAAAAPMPQAVAALQSNGQVTVETSRWLVFRPAGKPADADTGLVIYPGARVDPRAYAPAAQTIAAQGYLVVIVPMPLYLAVLAPDAAAEVLAAYPRVQNWAIAGHSLGGAMAARFAYTHPGAVKGLGLWAAYPAAGNSLAASGLVVVSISGSRDGLATVEKIDASRSLLPADTRWVRVEGGNHAQFGWYGPQDGDNAAAITREAQQAQVITATLEMLRALR